MRKLSLTDSELIREMRDIYRQRLSAALQGINEVEVHDKDGDVIVDMPLSVRSEEGILYTVLNVDEKAKVVELLLPEVPVIPMLSKENFEDFMNDKIEMTPEMLRDPDPSRPGDIDDSKILRVTFAEFNKKYKVKE
jgi:hypothetical protein